MQKDCVLNEIQTKRILTELINTAMFYCNPYPRTLLHTKEALKKLLESLQDTPFEKPFKDRMKYELEVFALDVLSK